MRVFRYEPKHLPLLPRRLFYNRLAINFLVGLSILTFFLTAGILGYHRICDLEWMDSLLNASMILSGMGPIIPTHPPAACDEWPCKVFESAYAIVSGVVFISTIGLILAPIVHRVFHRFHLADEER